MSKAPGYRGLMSSPNTTGNDPLKLNTESNNSQNQQQSQLSPQDDNVSVPITIPMSVTPSSRSEPGQAHSAPGTPGPGPIAPPRKGPQTPPPVIGAPPCPIVTPLRPSSLPDSSINMNVGVQETPPVGSDTTRVVGSGRNVYTSSGFSNVRSNTPPPVNPNLAVGGPTSRTGDIVEMPMPGTRIMTYTNMNYAGGGPSSGPCFTAPGQTLTNTVFTSALMTPISANIPVNVQSKLNPNAPDFSSKIASSFGPSGPPLPPNPSGNSNFNPAIPPRLPPPSSSSGPPLPRFPTPIGPPNILGPNAVPGSTVNPPYPLNAEFSSSGNNGLTPAEQLQLLNMSTRGYPPPPSKLIILFILI